MGYNDNQSFRERQVIADLGSVADLIADVAQADDIRQLARCLADRVPLTGVPEVWQDLSDLAHRSPGPQRAAILQGLFRARSWQRLDLGDLPQPEELLSRQAEELVPRLIEVARAMTIEDRWTVARMDRHREPDQHFAALERVLEREGCRFNRDEYWYPSEVVELTANVSGVQGFVGCTALLLLNTLAGSGGEFSFDMRWERMAGTYLALTEPEREPILSAFRWVYESDEGFSPRGPAVPTIPFIPRN